MSQSCKIIGNTVRIALTGGRRRDTIREKGRETSLRRSARKRGSMICRNCGAQIAEGSLFCRKCGTSVTAAEEQKPEQNVFQDLKPSGRKRRTVKQQNALRQQPKREIHAGSAQTDPVGQENADKQRHRSLNKRGRFLLIGAAVLLLAVFVIVIVAVTSCKKPERFTSPEAVKDAVVSALERGNGKRLSELAKLSEPVLGRHPETYGDGDTPEAVMRGYYDRMAGDLKNRLTEQYGKNYRLESATETRIITGTEIFEPNRALDLDAAQYAEITGTLTVEGETVANIRIVAAEQGGEWKLLVVYIY